MHTYIHLEQSGTQNLLVLHYLCSLDPSDCLLSTVLSVTGFWVSVSICKNNSKLWHSEWAKSIMLPCDVMVLYDHWFEYQRSGWDTVIDHPTATPRLQHVWLVCIAYVCICMYMHWGQAQQSMIQGANTKTIWLNIVSTQDLPSESKFNSDKKHHNDTCCEKNISFLSIFSSF